MAASRGEMTVKEMQKRIYMIDKDGFVRKGRTDLYDFKITYIGFNNEIVQKLGISAVIGVSGCPGLINN
jgi:hypothetical protein